MTEKEMQVMKSALEKVKGAITEIQTLPVNSWGPLIDTETRLTQADKYLSQFMALCKKRNAEVQ